MAKAKKGVPDGFDPNDMQTWDVKPTTATGSTAPTTSSGKDGKTKQVGARSRKH